MNESVPVLCGHCQYAREHHTPVKGLCPTGSVTKYTPMQNLGLGRIQIITGIHRKPFVHLPDKEREADGADFLVVWTALSEALFKIERLEGRSRRKP